MLIKCDNLAKYLKDEVLFENISFQLDEGEKCAIVGNNGVGKTTLLRILTGELESDKGDILFPGDKKIGYLAQNPDYITENTIIDEMWSVKQDMIDLERAIDESQKKIATLSGEALEKELDNYHRMTNEYEQNDGYSIKSRIIGILKGLGFEEESFAMKLTALSGGQKSRVMLGKLLLLEPDLLILDEPTNHLDIQAIEWLESYLDSFKKAVIIVSHDRYFLDKTVNRIIHMSNNTAASYKGNYSDFIHSLELRNIELDESHLHFRLTPEKESGNDVLSVEGLKKQFDENVLFEDVNFEVKKRDRIAIIGTNGTGKTTLLKIICELIKQDAGTISYGTNVALSYFDQEQATLDPDKTLFDDFHDAYPKLNNTAIRNTLGAFMFRGDDVFKEIKSLSGGERGRLAIAKLLLKNANLLILDEPTNHLDIESKEILENALINYEGTIMYVSHDRYFIKKTATRIFELKNRQFIIYDDDYDYYLAKKENMERRYLKTDAAAVSSSANVSKITDSQQEWINSKQLSAEKKKCEREIKRCEKSIEELEEKLDEIQEKMMDESIQHDYSKLNELTKQKDEYESQLEDVMTAWEEASIKLEEFN